MVVELTNSPFTPVEIAARAAVAERARRVAAANGAPALIERPVGEGRRLRVICIGAGFSGIGAAIYLPQHVPNLDLQLYERAEDVGGVWHHNRYMGAACDIPAHTYQFSFANNPGWSKFYAGQEEIREYLLRVTDHYGIRPMVQFRHEVTEAKFREDGQWTVTVKNLATGETFVDTADLVLYATGLLSHPTWPKIPGREEYKGILRHTGSWKAAQEEAEGMDWSDKTVGVIGAGSSAIQVVPVMASKCKNLVNFGRSPTWITPTFGEEMVEKLGMDMKTANHVFTAEEKAKFGSDPEAYRNFRLTIERDLGSFHYVTHRNSQEQEYMYNAAREGMEKKLASRPEVAQSLIPNFTVACKRLTPGPGYLEALTEDHVTLETSDLECFTAGGLRTKSGKEYKLDAIICGTGFDVSSVPKFPIVGLDGINLQDEWSKQVETYLAVSIPKMPNFFSVLGAQAVVGSGNLLIMIEAQLRYIGQAIKKIQAEGYKYMVVKDQCAKDFARYTDDYFARTVFTTDCPSWYKGVNDGHIRTLWPGSSQHCVWSLRNPRWEDYEFEREPEYKHTMAWLGDGHIPAEADPAFYYDELRAGFREQVFFPVKA
ncbi:hypothetical protein CspHIS471_0211980 [Cutaneotrichosporon sp. HIS471]|nr:hypothetical protein CspHIS471_0211980 [Cutaneotrichosporon sp. HIS471]